MDGIALEEDDWEDSLTKGARALRELGHSARLIIHTSLGADEFGNPQILIIHSDHVELLNDAGDQKLEVGDRDIRALRPITGKGLELCISNAWLSDATKTRWIHCIPDADARFLEDYWIKRVPFTHTGTHLATLPWREEEYSRHAGRIIIESARCDASVGHLALRIRQVLGLDTWAGYGDSGSNLAKQFNEAAQHSSTIHRLAEIYSHLSEQRHHIAHGVFIPNSTAGSTQRIFKPNRGKHIKSGEPAFIVRDEDFSTLANIVQDLHELGSDANRLSFHLDREGSAKEVLAKLPALKMSYKTNPRNHHERGPGQDG